MLGGLFYKNCWHEGAEYELPADVIEKINKYSNEAVIILNKIKVEVDGEARRAAGSTYRFKL